MQYYTVLFGVSRAFGVAAQLIWDRALGARQYYPLFSCFKSLDIACSPGTAQVLLYDCNQTNVRRQSLDYAIDLCMYALITLVIHSMQKSVCVPGGLSNRNRNIGNLPTEYTPWIVGYSPKVPRTILWLTCAVGIDCATLDCTAITNIIQADFPQSPTPLSLLVRYSRRFPSRPIIDGDFHGINIPQ